MFLLLGLPDAEHGEGEPETHHGVGDGDAREDEDAEAGEQDECGVEAGSGAAKGEAGECFDGERQREDRQRERDAGSDGEAACGRVAQHLRDAHGRGHRPVEQRSFLQVADSVGVERDPVVAQEHFAGDFGVDGVGVVEQRGAEEREAGVERDPEHGERERRRERALRRACGGHIATIFESESLTPMNTDGIDLQPGRPRMIRIKTDKTRSVLSVVGLLSLIGSIVLIGVEYFVERA